MTVAVALLLLGAGLALWPVTAAAERRVVGLRALARLTPTAVDPGAGPVSTPIPPASRRVAVLAVAAAVALAVLATGPALAVAGGALLATVAVVVAGVRADRRAEALRRGLDTGLAVLTGELGAGTAFPAALAAARHRAGPAAAAFTATVAGPTGVAADLADARRVLTAGAGLVTAAGAPWAGVAEGVARDVAARAARAREVATAVAGARASTLLLAGLPVLGVGLAAGMGAAPLDFLLGTAAGRVVLAASALLELAGVAAGAALARRAGR